LALQPSISRGLVLEVESMTTKTVTKRKIYQILESISESLFCQSVA